MPYTIPTADDFTTRFPIFADKDEDLITSLLAEAASQIDETWREADYQPAVMYLTAHLLATDNSGEGEEVDVGVPASISSESFAGMSVSYGSGTDNAISKSTYGTTEYGRRYYALLIKNKPGVTVA